MKRSVSVIFHERQSQWGLRGDPYLWDELETHFSDFLLPFSEEDLLKEFFKAVEQLTGNRLDSNEHLFVPRYNHGGMSSGMISSNFWLEKALPLLIDRLK